MLYKYVSLSIYRMFLACSSGCKTCSSSTMCSECKVGYTMLNNACTGNSNILVNTILNIITSFNLNERR